MKLAGLEPATSWVRSSRIPTPKMPLQPFIDERLECRNTSRNTVRRFLQTAGGMPTRCARGSAFPHRRPRR